MRRSLFLASVAIVALVGYALLQDVSASNVKEKASTQLSHDVYFTLKDNSPEAKKKLVAACKKYLSKHEGEVFFAAGARAEMLKREGINDLQFDVALHIVFKDMASYEKYADAKRHHEFIDENKGDWKSVRVFDSLVER
jgi:Stress responsive A/B Barrel Domain